MENQQSVRSYFLGTAQDYLSHRPEQRENKESLTCSHIGGKRHPISKRSIKSGGHLPKAVIKIGQGVTWIDTHEVRWTQSLLELCRCDKVMQTVSRSLFQPLLKRKISVRSTDGIRGEHILWLQIALGTLCVPICELSDSARSTTLPDRPYLDNLHSQTCSYIGQTKSDS